MGPRRRLRSRAAISVAVWIALSVTVVVDPYGDRGSDRGPDEGGFSASLPLLPLPPVLMVVGDSYTSGPDVPGKLHDDEVGSERRGWWSFLADDLGYDPVISAEPGSGMLKNGLECAGTTFGDRADEIVEQRPEILIIEGGRNDFNYCVTEISRATGVPVSSFTTVRSNDQAVETAVRAYLDQVKKAAAQIGLAPERIYLTMPWGGTLLDLRPPINAILQRETAAAGIQYVDLPPLADDERYDETHPNGFGSERIYEQFMDLSDIARWRVQ